MFGISVVEIFWFDLEYFGYDILLYISGALSAQDFIFILLDLYSIKRTIHIEFKNFYILKCNRIIII